VNARGGRATGEERARLEALEDFAREKGAYRARVFAAADVVVDERVRMKCQIPLCAHYGRSLTCPPNVPSVEEFRKALGNYREALLLQTRSSLSGEIDAYDKQEVLKFFKNPAAATQEKGGEGGGAKEDFRNVKLAAARLHQLVNDVESKAMSLGFPYALGLIGGECLLCPTCVGPCAAQGCRRPFEARAAMEGVGIDVLQTSVKAGLPFDMPPKTEIVWTGLLLID
jgi:predicted metal-binding protein